MRPEHTEFATFKSKMIEKHGPEGTHIRFRTVGANGWSDLDVDERGPKFVPAQGGPHYTDISPGHMHKMYNSGKLLGKFNHNTGEAKEF